MADLAGGQAPTVLCPACRFENPAGEKYCQDCGARLPDVPAPPERPHMPTIAAPSAPFVPPPETPTTPKPAPGKRYQPKIYDPLRTNWLAKFLRATVGTLIAAALTALVIQLLRPPDGLPAEAPPFDNAVIDRALLSLRERANLGGLVDLQWPQINSYLATRLGPEGSGWFTVKRAAVAPDQKDHFRLYIVRQVLGVPVYTVQTEKVIVRGNGLSLEPTAAQIGRIPLPAWLADLTGTWGTGLETTLDTELTMLGRAGNVSVASGGVQIQFSAP